MREIDIYLPKEDYELGEDINGYVIIRTDKSFECNSVNITFRIHEQTRIVKGS
ncbi:MAG: hypothetical protein ACFE7R_11310 [Candidatus Hodarchaeota archaeon]